MTIKRSIIAVLILTLSCFAAPKSLDYKGCQRIAIDKINTDELIAETQPTVSVTNDHMCFAWWIPTEFWNISLTQDKSVSKSDIKEFIDTMKPYTIIAICQADISAFGSFSFYSESKVKKRLSAKFTNSNNKEFKLSISTNVSGNAKLLIQQMKPILTAAMGNMGSNMHFFVFDNPKDKEIDPYAKGNIKIDLIQKNNTKTSATINLPLNSLYTPRLCPNGKPAHISWDFCPWTGKKLN